jgi:carbamoyltransferase
MEKNIILGISAFYHDSAAAIIVDGKIIAAAQEERFTRIKHDSSFPENAVKYVVEEAGVNPKNIKIISFYEKPLTKFERLLETYHYFAPKGFSSFAKAIPIWVKEKLFIRKEIRTHLQKLGVGKYKLLFPEHHLSHASSAFYPSPYEDAAILTIDGMGEWASLTISKGESNNIKILKQINFPHSLGLLYSAFTYYCGFKVNSGEYKLMGLAPYGNPDSSETKKYKEIIYKELIDVREDGSFVLNMDYFDFAVGLRMCKDNKWADIFGLKRREFDNEDTLDQSYMNMALAIQQVTEEIVIKLAKTAKEITGSNNIVMAGGVALNCVANGKLAKEKIFKNIWGFT